MKTQLKAVWLGLLLLLTLISGAACSGADAATPENSVAQSQVKPAQEIKLGFAGPLTGGAAFIGQEQLGFIKAAVDVFNQKTGLNVRVVEADTKLEPDEAKIVAERLAADDNILAVFGPTGSQECEATQPVFAEAGLAHITASCTRTSLTEPGTPTFFRPIPHDGLQGPTDARFMVEKLGVKSVYLVDEQTSYAAGLLAEVEGALQELGVTNIQRASITQEEMDFSSLATSIVAAKPDAVFFPSQVANQMANLITELRAQGYEGHYFLGDGGFDTSWPKAAGAAAEGAYVSFFAPDPRFIAPAKPYIDRYSEKYGESYGAFGGAAALSAQIVLEALERCHQAKNLSRACLIEEIKATNISESLLAIPVSFGAGNQLNGGEFFIFQVKQGEFVLIK